MHHNDLARLIIATAEGGDGASGGSGGSGNGSGGQGGNSGATGGQGDGGNTGDPGGQAGGDAGQGSGGSGGAQHGHDGSAGRDAERKLESQPQWVQQMVRELRDEAAGNRTKRNAAEAEMTALQRKVAEAFGIDVGGDGKPDPDKLAADLAEAQRRERTRSVELAVYRSAGDRADPATLLDSRSFLDSVAELDPGAQDFQTRLGDKIATWAQDNPRQSAGGGNTGGRPGGGIGQGGRGQQSGPTGVAAGRALHPASKAHQNASTT